MKPRPWSNTSWLTGMAVLTLAIPVALVLTAIVVVSELAGVEWGPAGETPRRRA